MDVRLFILPILWMSLSGMSPCFHATEQIATYLPSNRLSDKGLDPSKLQFTVDENPNSLEIHIYYENARVGRLLVFAHSPYGDQFAKVSDVQLGSEVQRKGLGQLLYLYANDYTLQKWGKSLSSSSVSMMGNNSKALWKKLVETNFAWELDTGGWIMDPRNRHSPQSRDARDFINTHLITPEEEQTILAGPKNKDVPQRILGYNN